MEHPSPATWPSDHSSSSRPPLPTKRHGMRGEIRLDKEKSGDKIDGIAALAMALSRAMVQTSTVSIYESRGVLVLG